MIEKNKEDNLKKKIYNKPIVFVSVKKLTSNCLTTGELDRSSGGSKQAVVPREEALPIEGRGDTSVTHTFNSLSRR